MDEPADNTKTLPFECTMEECKMRFKTLKDMKLHKHTDPDHFYCKKCDVDCVDHDDLIQVIEPPRNITIPASVKLTVQQHMVTAMSPWVDGPMRGNREVLPKHIVCEFCGQEYKSFGGRRIHREQVCGSYSKCRAIR